MRPDTEQDAEKHTERRERKEPKAVAAALRQTREENLVTQRMEAQLWIMENATTMKQLLDTKTPHYNFISTHLGWAKIIMKVFAPQKPRIQKKKGSSGSTDRSTSEGVGSVGSSVSDEDSGDEDAT